MAKRLDAAVLAAHDDGGSGAAVRGTALRLQLGHAQVSALHTAGAKARGVLSGAAGLPFRSVMPPHHIAPRAHALYGTARSDYTHSVVIT